MVSKHSTQNIIFNCTSKGNHLPNGLSLGSTNPLYFMMTAPSMKVTSPLRSSLLIPIPGSIAYSRHDFFYRRKSVPMGGNPYNFLSSTSSPSDASPPINSLGGLSKTHGATSLWLIPHCSVKLFKMVQTLEKLVLLTVPFTALFDLLQAVWHLPLRKECLTTLFRRSNTVKLTSLAKQLPWDHPVA